MKVLFSADYHIKLKTFIENTSEQYDLATDLEYYFLGSRTGCNVNIISLDPN